MTKPVTLSEEAFRELRKEKRPHESTSDVVLRLIRTAHAKKDPSAILRFRGKKVWSREEHLAIARESRDIDIDDPWSHSSARS